jgi:hypothetical protein
VDWKKDLQICKAGRKSEKRPMLVVGNKPNGKSRLMKAKILVAFGVAIFCGFISAPAQTWTQTIAPKNSWYSIASSADGTKLAAVIPYANAIYTSTNSGATWASNNVPAIEWWSVAASADGSKLIAAASYGGSGIFTSTNSGATWVSNIIPNYAWFAVASSADGARLVAVAGGGQDLGPIYTSTDSGGTWISNNAPASHWISVASSADGNKLIALTQFNYYTSTNAGNTWTSNGIPSVTWTSVASSADGNKLVAAVIASGTHHIFTSTDSGSTWITNNASIVRTTAVASSADGATLAEVELNWIWLSTNSGVSWISNNVAGSWHGVTTSADGAKLAVADAAPGGIWTLQNTPTPSLSIAPTNGIQLSWLITSTEFVVQQSFDLASWSDITNAPVLNPTNLQNQVTLPLSTDNSFYRLKTP